MLQRVPSLDHLRLRGFPSHLLHCLHATLHHLPCVVLSHRHLLSRIDCKFLLNPNAMSIAIVLVVEHPIDMMARASGREEATKGKVSAQLEVVGHARFRILSD